MIQAPIPGQSLTTPPGNFPYERPPEINDPEEAIQMHLTRLNNSEMRSDILDALELDVSVRELTEGILRSAVAEGIHSIDTSLIVAPVVHEFIRLVATEEGVEFDEGLVDKKEEEKRTKAVTVAKAKKMLSKFLKENPEEKVEAPLEEEEMAPTEGESPTEPRGFMKRRTV
jgi:hypothetical protein